MPSNELSIWIVYKHPRDYPNHYVARRFVMDKATNDVLLADNLEALRSKLPTGLHHLYRHPKDDPCIVEVWV